jgi:hypothetical protein
MVRLIAPARVVNLRRLCNLWMKSVFFVFFVVLSWLSWLSVRILALR